MGLKQGLEQGREESRKKALMVAKNLLDVLDDATISLKTGIEEEIIKALR